MTSDEAKAFRKLNNEVARLTKTIKSLEEQIEILSQKIDSQRPIVIHEPTYPTTPTIPLGPYFDDRKPYKPFYGPVMSCSDNSNNIKPC